MNNIQSDNKKNKIKPSTFVESENPNDFYHFLNPLAINYLENILGEIHNTYCTEGNLTKLTVHCSRCAAAHTDEKYHQDKC